VQEECQDPDNQGEGGGWLDDHASPDALRLTGVASWGNLWVALRRFTLNQYTSTWK
jgi:hypothetical protein